MPTKSKPVVQKDPDNRRTVILDRWPTKVEKDAGVRDEIRKVRSAVHKSNPGQVILERGE